MKRKRIEAWGVASIPDERLVFVGSAKEKSDYWSARGRLVPKSRVARLVEHEPAADAVVRAAKKLAAVGKFHSTTMSRIDDIQQAVDRLERARAK